MLRMKFDRLLCIFNQLTISYTEKTYKARTHVRVHVLCICTCIIFIPHNHFHFKYKEIKDPKTCQK